MWPVEMSMETVGYMASRMEVCWRRATFMSRYIPEPCAGWLRRDPSPEIRERMAQYDARIAAIEGMDRPRSARMGRIVMKAN